MKIHQLIQNRKTTQKVTEYLTKDRNLSENTLDTFEIGFENNPISIFCNRITIPLKNFDGNILAFQNRSLPWTNLEPKYLISKGFDKQTYVYGLCELLVSGKLDTVDYVVWTEGNFNVLAYYQEGFPAVCTMGASISEFQAYLIGCVTNNIIYVRDNDEASEKHFEKNFNTLTKFGHKVRPLCLPSIVNDYNDLIALPDKALVKKFNEKITNESRYF